MKRVLVAGVGNVFAGDDGFGVAVVRAARTRPLADSVILRDVGVRTLHLAYELAEDWALCIVVDAIPLRTRVGTLHLIEPCGAVDLVGSADGHRMDLGAILSTTRSLGATPPPILLVGCEVGPIRARMKLSRATAAAVEPAIAMIERAVARYRGEAQTSHIEEPRA